MSAAKPCAFCDHDPACGVASVFREQPVTKHKSIYRDGQSFWLCHTDDHSCYEKWVIEGYDVPVHPMLVLDGKTDE